jgi:hypothetical protein
MSTQGEYTKSKRDLERRQNFKMSQPSDPNPATPTISNNPGQARYLVGAAPLMLLPVPLALSGLIGKVWINIAEATIARQHIRPTLFK